MNVCPCCEVREVEAACAKCERWVCDQCIQPKGEDVPVVCYCGTSCTQFEREWQEKQLARRKR